MVVLGNCGESESDKAIEYSEGLNDFYFPLSPTYFPPLPTTFPPSPSYSPLYSPPSPPRPSPSNSGVIYVWDAGVNRVIFGPQNKLGEEIVDLPNFHLALVVEHKIQDRGGALDVIPSGRVVKINEWVEWLGDIVESEAKNTALQFVDENDSLRPKTQRWSSLYQDFEPLEKQNEDIVDQLVMDSVDVTQHLIQYRDGALDGVNELGGVSRFNGSEISNGQLLTSTPEPALIFQTKLSLRLWQGHRGQWVADICYGWNWLNTGTLKTAEGSFFSSEWVLRFRGGKDLFDHASYELLVYENRTEPTTKPRTEIQTLELSPTEEQENLDEDFELVWSEATGNDGVEAEATRNDGVIGGCNGCDDTPIQVVDQEGSPQLINCDNLPSDQAVAVTVDTNSVVGKEIPPLQLSRTAQQKNSDKAFGNDEVEEGGTEGQFDSRCSAKRRRKEKNPRRERRNKKTTGVRIGSPLVDNLQTKGRSLKNDAKRLKGTYAYPPPRDEIILFLSIFNKIDSSHKKV